MSTNKELAANLTVAEGLIARMKGLLGRSLLPPGEALWIKPCKGVHTFGMTFPIDVVFLDRDNSVIACQKGLAPNRMTPVHLRSASVIELPAGVIDATATEIGNQLEIS